MAGVAVSLNQVGKDQQVSVLPLVVEGGVVNAGSGLPTIAPGSFISIYGQNLSDETDTWSSAIQDGITLPTALKGISVRVNGRECFVYFVSPSQINVLTPPDTGQGLVPVEVITKRGTVMTTVRLAPVAPGWLTYGVQGQMHIAALFAGDYGLVAPPNTIPGVVSRAAKAGDYLQLYATGLGHTNPTYPAGRIFPSPLPITDLSQVRVLVGGQQAEVLYTGMISPGLFQVNIRVPASVAGGSVPVVVEVNGVSGQKNAVLAFAN